MISRRDYLGWLAGLFAVVWLLLAIDPYDRRDWLLENVLLVVFVAALLASCRALPLSKISYTMIVLFLILHAIGAHYTYSLVPWTEWVRGISGGLVELNDPGRNHFDRLAHFCYGLLLAYPIREVLLRVAGVRGFWGYLFPLVVTLATSVLYEFAEWWAAETFGGDLGIAFVGTQGDVWDAQKDMALAGLGATIVMAVTGTLNYALDRDFALEWTESLRVKNSAPLGEDELLRLWNEGKEEKDGSEAAGASPANGSGVAPAASRASASR